MHFPHFAFRSIKTAGQSDPSCGLKQTIPIKRDISPLMHGIYYDFLIKKEKESDDGTNGMERSH